MSIAIAKGIFRLMFTMMDKEENYETKRYTAIREGLTEMIAIPVYYLSGVVSEFTAKNFLCRNTLCQRKFMRTTSQVTALMKSKRQLCMRKNLRK